MRMMINETWESWSERARLYELECAKSKIAKGIDIDVAMTEMVQNLSKKLLHPVLMEIRASVATTYDAGQDRQSYMDNYPGYIKK